MPSYICTSAEDYALTVNVRLQCSPLRGTDIEITDLYADTPGQGDGTRAMQNICELADSLGHNLYLHPECERNKGFYARFGFVSAYPLRYPGLQLIRYFKEDE